MLLPGRSELSGEAEITDLKFKVVGKEQVGEGEVSVQDGVSVQVPDPVQYLPHKSPH